MYRPLNDRIVIRPAPREEQTATGILLPDTGKERPERGTVVAVGPGRVSDEGVRMPVNVEVGDEVLFAKYAGQEIGDYLVVKEADVYGVFEAA